MTIIPIELVKEIKVSDLSKSSYPILTDIGIPLSRTFLSALLRELVMLDKADSEAGVLSYSKHRGTTCRLLSIPKSSTEYRFRRNAKHWLKPLFSDCTDCRDDSKAALWAMKAIASEYEVEFIQAAEDCGYPILTRKMDEATAAAMWYESNTLKRNSRIISQYLLQAYGMRFTLPESTIEEKLGADHLVPDCGMWTNNGETIHYWTKPIDGVVIKTLARKCKHSLVEMKKVASVDIVVGGDHRQGKFRAMIKIILRYVDVELKNKMIVIKVGHIEAKKDTYEILKNTVTPEMNDAIKRIKQGGNVLRIFENAETGEIELTFSNDVLLNEASGCKWAMPVRVFLSGDLAFFATVLGEVNSSGSGVSGVI